MSEPPRTSESGDRAEPAAPEGGERRLRPRLGYSLERGLGVPTLFAIAFSGVGMSIYVALGVVAGHALGLTPLIMLGAAIAFAVTTMSYTEAALLHPERGGSAAFARHAFNELWSFVAGWAILLDYLIVLAVTSLSVPHYFAGFWNHAGDTSWDVPAAIGIIVVVALLNVRGFTRGPRRWWTRLSIFDLVVQVLIVALGFVLVFHPSLITQNIHLGSAPTWEDAIFAVAVIAISYTGIEAAANLAPELKVTPAGLRRVISVGAVGTVLVYVGISAVALMAVPIEPRGGGFETALGSDFVDAPVIAVVANFGGGWVAGALRYLVAGVASLVLFQAANAAMLGVSRLSYSLARNRQVPGMIAKLHPTRATPYISVFFASLLAMGLVASDSSTFLVGIFAFGAMIAFALTHLSVIVLRFREPDRPRPFRMPLNIQFGTGSLPVLAVAATLTSVLAWASVVALHGPARYVGGGWMLFGIALYLIYRRAAGMSITRQVEVEEAALQEAPKLEYASILVPVFGKEMDDDIMGTAGRLAAESTEKGQGAVILALHVLRVPISLPVDAKLPAEQIEAGRRALARAKEVGEEYEDVKVATMLIRARWTGAEIVEQARRHNVEAIVMGGEKPSKVGGGPMLGGLGGRRTPFIGAVTEHVIRNAPCRVIITAPPEDAAAADGRPGGTDERPVPASTDGRGE